MSNGKTWTVVAVDEDGGINVHGVYTYEEAEAKQDQIYLDDSGQKTLVQLCQLETD